MSNSHDEIRLTFGTRINFTPLLEIKDSFVKTIEKMEKTLTQYNTEKKAFNDSYIALTNEAGFVDFRAHVIGASAELCEFIKTSLKTLKPSQSFTADLDHLSTTDQCKRTIPGSIQTLTDLLTRLSAIDSLQNLHPEENPDDVLGHQLKVDCEEALKALAQFKTIIDQLNGTNDAKQEPKPNTPSITP